MLRVERLRKSYGVPVVDDVDFTLERGRILGLLGPSGCGKTTLLRLIGGLEQPDAGRVWFDGSDLTGVPAHRRGFGLMFQEFALFPHRTAAQNAAFGLEMLNISKRERANRAAEMLDLVGLSAMAQRNVGDLSGGERQRVALARSLAPRPSLLMLDEPLGALDRELRERLLVDIRSILREMDQTAIFVTHDQSEALAVSDVTAVMHRGRLLQTAAPEALYRRPANETVARFLGFKNIFDCRWSGGRVRTEIGLLSVPTDDIKEDAACKVLIRPEAVRVLGPGDRPGDGESEVEGTVSDRLFRGPVQQAAVRTETGARIHFELPGRAPAIETGSRLRLAVRAVLLPVEE